LLNVLKKLFFWNYARNTWQWDVLCVVILIFIFLTPKSWFENGERRASFAHQIPTSSIFLIDAELIENAEDKGQLEHQLRSIMGRKDLQVIEIRKVVAEDGKIRGYEVDIR
jgi:hypothetical protein